MNNKNKENLAASIDYQFIPVPRELYYNPEYIALPNDAKHLFILIIDRIRLSQMNPERFSDKNGKAFIYLTLEEVADKLNISLNYATKLFNALADANLVSKRRQGQGKPNVIQLAHGAAKLIENRFNNRTADESEIAPQGFQDSNTVGGNNNDMNNNELNNNYSITYEEAIEQIKEQIEYDCINGDNEIVAEIIMIMYDVIYGTASTVRIGANVYPRSAVVARYKKLEAEHIENVINALETTTTKITNVKSFLITALYNAPATANSSVTADFAYHYKHLKNLS